MQFWPQAIRNPNPHAILTYDRPFRDGLEACNGMGRRIYESVFRSEKWTVHASKGVSVVLDQVDALPVAFEVTNAPLAASVTSGGTSA